MNKIWASEKHAFIIAIILIVVIGVTFDNWFVAFTITLGGYIFWLYLRLVKLEKWLAHGTKVSEVYDDSGFIGDIIRQLYRQKKVHNKRKKSTKQILRRLNRNIAALPDATVLLNEQLEIEWSNSPAQYLLGINQRFDIGQRISNLFRHPTFLRYLISPDRKTHLELESPSNPNITLQIKIVRFGHNQRLLTARNVSDQKQLREALKKFVANASHELKTPLTSIMGHLEMLGNEPGLSTIAQHSIKVAEKQSKRMEGLIQNLLLLSQVESYQLQPGEGDRISINDVMKLVMSSIDESFDRKLINYSYPQDFFLLGIQSEIEGICINLVDNAIKYSKEKQLPIDISWSKNENGEYVFKVSDQGPGISEQDLPYITERYFRGSQETATQNTGSGLGLAIVKQAAEKHGATLTIESEAHQGSTFIVTFPNYRVLSNKKITL